MKKNRAGEGVRELAGSEVFVKFQKEQNERCAHNRLREAEGKVKGHTGQTLTLRYVREMRDTIGVALDGTGGSGSTWLLMS